MLAQIRLHAQIDERVVGIDVRRNTGSDRYLAALLLFNRRNYVIKKNFSVIMSCLKDQEKLNLILRGLFSSLLENEVDQAQKSISQKV